MGKGLINFFSMRRAFLGLKNLLMPRSAYRFFLRDWITLTDLGRCADAVATMRYSVSLEPVRMVGPNGDRIMVIAPHPDDEILGPGGTLIKSINGGSKVRVIYLTSGKMGQAADLEREALRVAELVGYETRFLGYSSRRIPLSDGVAAELRTEIDRFSPNVLMLPFFCDDHDDHRRASHLLLRAHKARPLPFKLEIWAYQVYSALIPNVVVDITAVAERKLEVIGLWHSQSGSRDWGHFSLGLNAFNSRFLTDAAGPRYAEAFFVLPAHEYCDVCSTYFDHDPAGAYYSKEYAGGVQ